MKLYRIGPKMYLENYQGLGASYQDGGRWNRVGQPVLYFAQSPATALLEMGNYLPSPRLTPKNYQLGIYKLPDDLALDQISCDQLIDDWAQFPYPSSTQDIGGKWLDLNQSIGLIVPSAAVPAGLEKNILINPKHKDISHLKLIESTEELYNHRIFSGLK